MWHGFAAVWAPTGNWGILHLSVGKLYNSNLKLSKVWPTIVQKKRGPSQVTVEVPVSARWVCLGAPVPLCPANFYRVCLGGSLTGLCSLLCACLPGKFLFSLQRCTVLLSVAANWRHTQFITVTQCCCADWEACLNCLVLCTLWYSFVL